MTSKSIAVNRLTSSGKLDSLADSSGGYRPILLGRMDLSSVSDGTDLKGSSATQAGWSFDHASSTITKFTDTGTPYARAVYQDKTGGGQSWPSIYFTFAGGASPQEVYIQFYARRDGSIMSGSKFVKLYDQGNGTSNYANVTLNNGYTSSGISAISFGNGTNLTSDTDFAFWYSTGHNDTIFERYPAVPPAPSENVLTRAITHGGDFLPSEWGNGTQWHKWQFRIKKNSGTSAATEVNDGIFEAWVDGVPRLIAHNIMNRHYSNSLTFGSIEFMSYMQDNLGFTLDMKNITVSRYGWID